MRNADCFGNQELEVMNDAPMTSEEAHQRIVEAERGITNGEVVVHADVMKHSYRYDEKQQTIYIVDVWNTRMSPKSLLGRMR